MNQQQLLVLRDELASSDYTGMSYEQIVAALNARAATESANPEPQTSIPKPWTFIELFAIVLAVDPAGAKTAIEGAGSLIPDMREATEANNRASMLAYAQMLALWLNSDAQAAVGAALAETIPDPSWSATITTYTPSRAEELGLPSVRGEDVQAALHLVEA